ncbi:hypothetical protein [Dongia sp.]|uniref:hypothetical protein n=1 Tax=Dongia sp. TaxID=1977262 RepID=UPI0035B1A99B
MAAGFFAALTGLPSFAHADAPAIEWSIPQPLRLFRTQEGADRYMDLARTVMAMTRRKDFDSFVSTIFSKRYFVYGSESAQTRGELGNYLTQTYYRPETHDYDPTWLQQPTFAVDLYLTGAVPAGATCTWHTPIGTTLKAAGQPDSQPPAGNMPCPRAADGSLRLDTALSKNEISVDIRTGSTTQTISAIIEPRDYLIVTLGDSFGAGEGAPDEPRAARTHFGEAAQWEYSLRNYFAQKRVLPAHWWDQRCHRSLFSGSALAVAALVDAQHAAKRPQHASYSFISYACSGAAVFDGILTGYIGREVPSQIKKANDKGPVPQAARLDEKVLATPLPPQVENLARNLCSDWDAAARRCRGNYARQPDALILSTGGNDIGFGGVIRNMENDNRNVEEAIAAVRKAVDTAIEVLPFLNDLVANRVKALGIKAKTLVIMEYPDVMSSGFSAGDKEDICFDEHSLLRKTIRSLLGQGQRRSIPMLAMVKGMDGIRRAEAAFAHDHVFDALIKAVHRAAKQHGWLTLGNSDAHTVRTGFIGASLGNGYCARLTPFTLNFSDTNAFQGTIPEVTLTAADVGGLDRKTGSDAMVSDPAVKRLFDAAETAKIEPRLDAVSKTKAFGGIPSGIFHPNYLGYRNYAVFIAKRLDTSLGLGLGL